MEKLENCPFCGGKAQLRMTSDFVAYASCTMCGASTKRAFLDSTKKAFYPPDYKHIEEVATEAVMNWNSRV